MSGSSEGYPFTVVADRTVLLFVDRDFMMSDGSSGEILLDINNGTDYALMLNAFKPRPADQRQSLSDSPFKDGTTYSGLGKLEDVILPFSIKVIGDDVISAKDKLDVLMDEARKDTVYVVYAPDTYAPITFYSAHPVVSLDTDAFWFREFQNTNMAIVNFDLIASCGFGTVEELTPLENLAPNPSFEEGDLDEWTITVGGSSTITKEAGTVFDGSVSAEFVRDGGDCYMNSSYILVDTDDPFYLDGFLYSEDPLSFSLAADCYDEDDNYLDTVDFTGDSRGDSEWDREVMYLYHNGDITNYYIAPTDWPIDTVKIQLKAELLDDGTVYLDKFIFANVRHIPDHAFDGVIGLRIFPEDIKGDLPALCDFYISNPFTSPPWKEQESGKTVDINGIHALDTSHVYAVGDGGYIFFYDGLLWATQDSGVSAPLRGVSAFDDTHIWAVGNYGTIRFYGAPWTPQVYPETTPTFTDMALDIWTNPDTLTNWGKWEASGDLQEYNVGGVHCAQFRPAYGGYLDVTIESAAKCAVDNKNTYLVGIWSNSIEYGYRGTVVLQLYVSFFNAGGTYLSSKSKEFYPTDTWIQRSFYIEPQDYPWGTTQMKIGVRGYGQSVAPMGPPFSLLVDTFGIMLTDAPDLYGVHAISATNIVAVGQYGCIIESENGTTWAQRASGISQQLHSVHHEAGTPRWYAVGDNGTILTSPDGNTWTIRVSGTTKDLYGAYALDATHIWAVGEDGTILFSANAGVTWTLQTSGTTYTLRSIYAYDSSNVWASGDDGTLLYFNGSLWYSQNSGTSKNLNGISGLDDENIWIVGDSGLIIKGIYSPAALAITDLVIGQPKDYHEGYNPVVECGTGDIVYDPYRRWGTYRELDATETNEFLFNLASHALLYPGSYAIGAGLTFSDNTVFDKGTIHKFLETLDGTPITSQYQEDEIDLGDPDGNWKEVLLQDDMWDDIPVPNYLTSDDAVLGNINQVIELIAHASLSAVKLLSDYLLLMPTDCFVNIGTIESNYLIIDSTMGAVLDSLDGSPSTAMVHSPTECPYTPRFTMDREGVNLVLVAINDVYDDQRMGMVNLNIKYRPRYKLYAS